MQILLTEGGKVSGGGADHPFNNLRGFDAEVIERLRNAIAANSTESLLQLAG